MAVLSEITGESILRSLGIGAKYRGFLPMARILDQCCEDMDRDLCMSHSGLKWIAELFPELDTHQLRNLVRDFQRFCTAVWNNEVSREKYASYLGTGVKLMRRPTPTEFINDLSSYMWRQKHQ